MRRGFLFVVLGAIVVLLLFVLIGMTPAPRSPSAAEQRATEAKERQMAARKRSDDLQHMAETKMHEKLEEKKYKHWMKDEQGRMVPSEGYFAGDWFKKRRDGQAGLAEGRDSAVESGSESPGIGH